MSMETTTTKHTHSGNSMPRRKRQFLILISVVDCGFDTDCDRVVPGYFWRNMNTDHLEN
jgi:hypothetical protein